MLNQAIILLLGTNALASFAQASHSHWPYLKEHDSDVYGDDWYPDIVAEQVWWSDHDELLSTLSMDWKSGFTLDARDADPFQFSNIFSKPQRSADQLYKDWNAKKAESKAAMEKNDYRKSARLLKQACKIGDACVAQYHKEDNGHRAHDIDFHVQYDKNKVNTLKTAAKSVD